MRTSLLVVSLGLLLTAAPAFAGPVLLLADATRLENEISTHLVEMNTAFVNSTDAASRLLALYSALDARATTLRQAAARCAHGCSTQDLAAMSTAATDLGNAQVAYNAQVLQLQMAMQRENQIYTAVSNILKSKHETVKNSIGNIK